MTKLVVHDKPNRSQHDRTIDLLVSRLVRTGRYDEVHIKQEYHRNDCLRKERAGEWDVHTVIYQEDGREKHHYYEVKPTVWQRNYAKATEQFTRTELCRKKKEDWNYVLVGYDLHEVRRWRV